MFEVLCPVADEVCAYDKAPIPLEVLGLIKLSEDEGYFKSIKIWHDNVDPDPLAVGYAVDEYEGGIYLIARWGAEKMSFEHLLKTAVYYWKRNEQ